MPPSSLTTHRLTVAPSHSLDSWMPRAHSQSPKPSNRSTAATNSQDDTSPIASPAARQQNDPNTCNHRTQQLRVCATINLTTPTRLHHSRQTAWRPQNQTPQQSPSSPHSLHTANAPNLHDHSLDHTRPFTSDSRTRDPSRSNLQRGSHASISLWFWRLTHSQQDERTRPGSSYRSSLKVGSLTPQGGVTHVHPWCSLRLWGIVTPRSCRLLLCLFKRWLRPIEMKVEIN